MEKGTIGYSGIAQKLVNIMNECSYITKDEFNPENKYKYASAANVLKAVNAALVRNKVASIVTPTVLYCMDVTNDKGYMEHQVTVGVNILLIDAESGESVDIYGIGTGQDAGDKAAMKAQTAAIKYAYMLTLAISTGDDPESDARTDINNRKNEINKQPNMGMMPPAPPAPPMANRNINPPTPVIAPQMPAPNMPAPNQQNPQGPIQPMPNGGTAPNPQIYQCSSCGKPITDKVFEYSMKRFNRPICMECQHNMSFPMHRPS